MKVKTTLVALLLATVMVTTSYGADSGFLEGAEDCLNRKNSFAKGFFSGIILTLWTQREVDVPKGIKPKTFCSVVARWVLDHPERHHEHQNDLVRRACKEAWPELNTRVRIKTVSTPFRGD